jgi:hypothetical protein
MIPGGPDEVDAIDAEDDDDKAGLVKCEVGGLVPDDDLERRLLVGKGDD